MMFVSKSPYLNFPTTTEYTDLKQALANGTVDSRVSYKIDIGNQEILNLSKLPSANKFLDKMYEAYNQKTGEIFEKPTFELALDENITFRHKQLSSEELAAKYSNLKFSRDEQEGTFFEVGNSIISVYAKNEYYSIKPTVAVED